MPHPGGNITGSSIQQTDLAGKRLEPLHELVPGLLRLAILANVGYPAAVLEMGTVLAKLSELLFVEALRRYVEVILRNRKITHVRHLL